jgi:tetratricopeptide (TPR) repeat protein
MADALITFNIIPTTKDFDPGEQKLPLEDILKAREVMERGVKALPNDAELWLTLGQFVSYMAPASYLEDYPDIAATWRREGVTYLERAVELSGGNSAVSWQALGGASILKDAGELEASIRFYERAAAVTDDQELRDRIEFQIAQMRKNRDAQLGKFDAERLNRIDSELNKSDAYRRRTAAAAHVMANDLPFVSKTAEYLLGPPPHPAACAGPGQQSPLCATSWRDWVTRFENEEL